MFEKNLNQIQTEELRVSLLPHSRSKPLKLVALIIKRCKIEKMFSLKYEYFCTKIRYFDTLVVEWPNCSFLGALCPDIIVHWILRIFPIYVCLCVLPEIFGAQISVCKQIRSVRTSICFRQTSICVLLLIPL